MAPDNHVPQAKEATWQTENLVFDRDEYARKEFWDDRFKEYEMIFLIIHFRTNGFFDWYASWE
jgi:hypothetical protein